ncbi:hypothetical protein C7212DRAFT_342836 [Tuber magnatum]|uniref:Uncharacterized protein n=1 Tax=Tuber magnatum TaxID=42249 RepID=A0A317SVH3_9PEZI|nr:hypothetical protein C7212DRAFT_342836 [Tuber magnatum]
MFEVADGGKDERLALSYRYCVTPANGVIRNRSVPIPYFALPVDMALGRLEVLGTRKGWQIRFPINGQDRGYKLRYVGGQVYGRVELPAIRFINPPFPSRTVREAIPLRGVLSGRQDSGLAVPVPTIPRRTAGGYGKPCHVDSSSSEVTQCGLAARNAQTICTVPIAVYPTMLHRRVEGEWACQPCDDEYDMTVR